MDESWQSQDSCLLNVLILSLDKGKNVRVFCSVDIRLNGREFIFT